MFKQMQNPFEEVIQMPNSYFTAHPNYFHYPQKSSNIWSWIICIIVLIGGVFLFFIWKEKIKIEEDKQIELDNTDNSLAKLE
ncbi:hypothetical protein [Emticicia sp. 17c]|uniref:hypothetical protein n=1 Tax=Emticicia sp. 17c TaxID=3127704 RepID=UPI00301C2526